MMTSELTDVAASKILEERLIRIEAQLESLNRTVNLARGGLHVLVWLGGVALAVSGFVVGVLTYLHLRNE